MRRPDQLPGGLPRDFRQLPIAESMTFALLACAGGFGAAWLFPTKPDLAFAIGGTVSTWIFLVMKRPPVLRGVMYLLLWCVYAFVVWGAASDWLTNLSRVGISPT